MTLRTDAELDAALTALAAAEGISKQEVARRAILERYEVMDRRARIEAVSEEMLEKWGREGANTAVASRSW